MHVDSFLREAADIAGKIDRQAVDNIAADLFQLRHRQGRLFLIGLGGSAANCSHAAADFRRLCDIAAFTPTDNVAEFSARVNDDGWPQAFSWWLKSMSAGRNDLLMVLSVGGGTEEVSQPITQAVRWANQRGMRVIGIVGHDGGYTHRLGDLVVRIPQVNAKHVTPHTEAFQAVLWHCLVSHPVLQKAATKW